MTSLQTLPTRKRLVLAVRIFILAVFLVFAYFLVIRLVSEIFYLKALQHFHEGYYLQAAEDLEKAISLKPGYVLALREVGRAYGKLADLYPLDKAFIMAEKSKTALLKAYSFNPLDPQAAFYLALAEARLQSLYARRYPDRSKNPYNAHPYFHQAIRLRPNSISYHYTLARYLFREHKREELLKTVNILTGIYPSIYNRLEKEAFWTSDVRDAAKKGLLQAVKNGNEPGTAHAVLARVAEREKDWAGAIHHLKESMALGINPDRRKDYYSRLGRLFLENGQIHEAKEAFIEDLHSSDAPVKDLKGFFGIFEKSGFSEELPAFYEEVQAHFILSDQMRIVLAESLYLSGNFDSAAEVLEKINAKTPSAASSYWLARIAEKKRNMKEAGRFYEKAVSLQPTNKRYQKELEAFRKRHPQ